MINHFTPSYLTRSTKPVMDYDFVVFGDDVEWNDYDNEERMILTDEQEDEFYRLKDLGDIETHWNFKEYFRSRDNTLNQVLLGMDGLYYTQQAKDSSCSLDVGMTEDNRPRAVLRNILFALRYGHTIPKVDIRKALKEAFVIDQLITLLKAYRVGLEVDFYMILAKNSRTIRSDRDPDDYLVRLVKEFEFERGRPFVPYESADKRTIQEVLERTRYQ